MFKDAKEISKWVSHAYEACIEIQDKHACDDCPLRLSLCLENESFAEIADLAPASIWDDFLIYADESTIPEEEYAAMKAEEHDEFMRDLEREDAEEFKDDGIL